ncbi:MAG: hypothetical protein ACYC56_03640 [Candidatus Aquicultor sp.]
MGQINSLQEALNQRYSDKVKFAAFNIFYDDTEEVHDLINQVVRDTISLPVVFIDDELELIGYVDEPTVIKIIEQKTTGCPA